MMKKMLLALLALAVTAAPTFAADDSAPGMKPGMNLDMKTDTKHDMTQMMHRHPDMHRQMMQNPQHLLAMAYHKNLVTFAMALKKVAHRGDTVPRDFARAAITEMRRSADQMEINHEAALGSLPADQKEQRAEMAKMMSTHLAEMRSQLAQLEDLSKADRIDSKELLKHLETLFKGCEGMCREGGMCGDQGKRGRHGGSGCMHEMHGGQGGCGCMTGGAMSGKKMRGAAPGGWQEMMQQRHQMMEAMKAQDAELAKLVDAMNRAPKDKKQALMADVLTKLVQQRAAMDVQMEKLQELMKGHKPGGPMPPHSMRGMDSASEDAESYDNDADGMSSDDMDSDDASDDDGSSMDMKEMNMQDK